MLIELGTMKARLGLDEITVKDDLLLTAAIRGISARFDRECGRTLERREGITQEFDGDQVELRLGCFPVESVSRFELKETEAAGWVEQAGVDYLLRSQCVVVLGEPLGTSAGILRITYTGGYVPPGSTAAPGQTPLPEDLAMAAVEQVAYWYVNRERLGVIREWPKGGTYTQYSEADLLAGVQRVIQTHRVVAM
ncbi:MAG: hypothetical protein NTX27_04020 [Verrucomicrobia bacterium]|nr:hypothetical protein [Verrucomicrobiota bacterium]